MKKLTLFVCALIGTLQLSAQINSADSFCTGVAIPFSTPVVSNYYTWVTDTVNVNQVPASAASISVSGLSTPTYPCLVKDNGVWYAFICNYGSEMVTKLTFSGNPNSSTFTTTSLGPYGSGNRLEGIDIVKDVATGNWYGLVVNNSVLTKLSFGTSLANTPTSTPYTYSSMSWAHQVGVAKYGSNWIAFIADRNTSMVRADFGTSLANTPTFTSIPNVGGVQNPCNFAIHKEGANWYMLTSNLITGTVTRLNFGTNIQNNSPTGTALGNPGSYLTLPRSVTIINDCNQLYAYVLNESNSLMTKWDFGGSITNTPVVTSLGTKGLSNCNGAYPYVVDTSLYLATLNYGSSDLYRIKMLDFPPVNATNYYNPVFSQTFTTAGVKNITLYCGIGSPMGSFTFCKSVYAGGGQEIIRDTTACSGTTVVLNASSSGGTSYLWNTGATTPSISVAVTGKYWVTITGSPCASSDTATVTFTPPPSVSLGPDTTFCYTSSHTLKNLLPDPAGATYLWSTGATTQTMTTIANGTYWLKVSKNGCSGTDTVKVTFSARPPVNLGSDTIFCSKDSLLLKSQFTSTGYTYLWSTGSVTPTIKTLSTGTYWVRVTNNGCFNTDTINVTVSNPPLVDLGGDLTICDNSITLLKNLTGQGTSFLWSTGLTTQDLYVSKPGTYWLKVFDGNCSNTDTMNLFTKPSPQVFIGHDTSLCKDEQIVLKSNTQPAGSTYQWNTGDTSTSITVKTPGFYSLTVGYDSCGTTDSISIKAAPDPYIDLGPDADVCDDEPFYLPKNMVTGYPYSITWQDGRTDSIYTAAKPGLYVVKLQNKCGIVYDTMYLEMHNCSLYFPSAFSPNNDGLNDFAKLLGADLSHVTGYRLWIYNRWGQEVFYTDDVHKGWNGVFKGRPADMNVYFYMIKFKLKGVDKLMKGDITLVR